MNNAHLTASVTYHELVHGFDALLRHHDGDLGAFYRAAEQLKPLIPTSAATGCAKWRAMIKKGNWKFEDWRLDSED